MTGVVGPRSAAVRAVGARLAVLVAALLLVALTASSTPARAESPPVVEVRGRAGRALEGVRVWRRDGETWREIGRTGADGTLALPTEALKDAWDVAATADPAGPRDEGEGLQPGRRVTAGRAILAIDCGADVTIEVVEAESGQALPGFRWRWSTRGEETAWVAAGEAAPLLVGRDGVPYDALELEAPKGVETTVWLRDLPIELRRGWRRVSARGGQELHGVVALRRVTNLLVRPTNESGGPSSLVRAAWAYAGEGEHCATTPLAAQTEITLQAPYYRGARLTVTASGKQHGKVDLRLPMDLPPEPVEVKIPLTLEEEFLVAAPFSADPPQRLLGTGGGNEDDPDPAGAALDLRLTSFDGRPLAGARVTLEASREGKAAERAVSLTSPAGRTGRDGGLLLRDLRLGAYVLVATHPDALTVRREIRLERRGVPTTLAVAEPKGGDVEVQVVDEEGALLPFAGVTVLGARGADGGLAPGPTRLDPATDRLGRRVFRRLDPGEATLTAWYGPAKGTATVEVPDGGRAKARVVVHQKP